MYSNKSFRKKDSFPKSGDNATDATKDPKSKLILLHYLSAQL